MSDNERLRELAKQLPWDRPDPARRDAARGSLLAAANQSISAVPALAASGRRRWVALGSAFAAGALAAAAIAVLVVRGRPQPVTGSSATATATATAPAPATVPAAVDPSGNLATATPARITAEPSARVERTIVTTPTGIDETVHLHDGTLHLTVGALRHGDHLRVRTRDAAVEGAGEFDVVVTADALRTVTVRSGSAQLDVGGQHAVFLAAGQTWRASVITADLSPPPTTPDSRTPDKQAVVAPDSRTPDKQAVVAPDSRTPDSRTPDSRTPDKQAVVAPDSRTPDSRTPDKRAVVTPDSRAPDKQAVVAPDSRTPDRRTPDKQAVVAPDSRTLDKQAVVAPDSRTPDKRAGKGVPPDKASPQIVGERAGSGSGSGARRATTPTELHFRAGWALLRDGKAKEAALELGAAADADPQDPLAADARYFQAVALERAGDRAQAERVLVAFLDHAPRSLRRGRAAVLLGRLLAQRGDVDSARAWFRAAVDDADPAIAGAARAGLDALPPNR